MLDGCSGHGIRAGSGEQGQRFSALRLDSCSIYSLAAWLGWALPQKPEDGAFPEGGLASAGQPVATPTAWLRAPLRQLEAMPALAWDLTFIEQRRPRPCVWHALGALVECFPFIGKSDRQSCRTAGPWAGPAMRPHLYRWTVTPAPTALRKWPKASKASSCQPNRARPIEVYPGAGSAWEADWRRQAWVPGLAEETLTAAPLLLAG